MSTRTVLRPVTVISAGNMASATVTSTATVLQSLSMVSYSVTWTGTSPVGTLAVQGSDDYSLNPDGTVGNSGTWNTLPLIVSGAVVTSIPVSGNSGNGMIDIDGYAGYATRLLYTKASGTGTIVAICSGKVA